MNIQSICIIGEGKVGSSLAQVFEHIGKDIDLIGKSRSAQRAAAAKADLIIIAVQDQNIAKVCVDIAPSLSSKSTVIHCSGAIGCEVLISAAQAGCAVACVHPLNTFPTVQAALETFSHADHGSYCFISGAQVAFDDLQDLFLAAGFICAALNDETKVNYHAACVMACNYLTSLSEISMLTAENAGLNRDTFWLALQPLMQATLSNITKHGTSQALSGPIARGDVGTVKAHLNALVDLPIAVASYKALGQQALALAAQRNELSEEQLNQLTEVLS